MSDIGIQQAGLTSFAPAQQLKPSYLLSMEDTSGKTKKVTRFICMDKPEFLNGFVHTKGFYTDVEEEAIVTGYVTIISGVDKEKIVEVFLPSHRIINIRSLVYRAVKPQGK